MEWLQSYVTPRKPFRRGYYKDSEARNIAKGVSQGSCLGPSFPTILTIYHLL